MEFKATGILIAIFLLAFACSSTGVAATGPDDKAGPKRQQGARNPVVEAWVERMREIELRAQKGEGKKALRAADRLAAEIVYRVESGDASRLLGTLNVLRAVAAYNAGDERLALWHWHIALQMFPKFSEFRHDIYGEAGRFLEEHPLRRKFPPQMPNEDDVPIVGNVTPPRKKKAPKPKFPQGKRHALKEHVAVVVQAVIDKEGRVTRPVILKAEGEFTLVCASLEALWRWEFEPARIGGEPIDVYYNLTINFRPGMRF